MQVFGGQEQAQPQANTQESGQPSPKIDPEILNKLGLTEEDVRRLREQRDVERQHNIAIARQNGAEAYNSLARRETFHEIKLAGSVIEIGNIEYDDQLIFRLDKKWKEISSSPESVDLEPQLRGYIEAFGFVASENRRYSIAILALNFASKGGILNNQEAINKLLTAANNGNSPDRDRLEIADILQSFKDKPHPQLGVVGQSPEPEIRSAPPNPNSPETI